VDVEGAGPTFATDRLHLRRWRDSEAARLFDIRRRDDVAKWLGDPTPWPDLATAEKNIAQWRQPARSTPLLGVWAIATNAGDTPPVGTVSLGQLPRSDEIEIGWYLHPDSVGHGYASEAATALLTHALDAGAERVWALMWPDNHASARVARSIGMIDFGVIQDPWYGTDVEPMSQMFQARPMAEA